MSSFNLPYALACLYMGMTEEYDRLLTDVRSRYDQTKAFCIVTKYVQEVIDMLLL